MAQFSTLITYMLFIGLFVIVTSLGMNQLGTNYGATYDNTSFMALNQMAVLANQTQAIDTSTTTLQAKSGVTDIIGSLFSNGYTVLLLMKSSYTVFETIVEQAFITIGLGTVGVFIKQYLLLAALISVVVGIILTALLKVNL